MHQWESLCDSRGGGGESYQDPRPEIIPSWPLNLKGLVKGVGTSSGLRSLVGLVSVRRRLIRIIWRLVLPVRVRRWRRRLGCVFHLRPGAISAGAARLLLVVVGGGFAALVRHDDMGAVLICDAG